MIDAVWKIGWFTCMSGLLAVLFATLITAGPPPMWLMWLPSIGIVLIFATYVAEAAFGRKR